VSPQPSAFFSGVAFFAFAPTKIPDFVALQTAHFEVANVAIVIASAAFSQVQQQCGDGVSRHSRHPRRGANTIAIHEGHCNPKLFFAQAIHIEHNA
jgi:hypothetical protein